MDERVVLYRRKRIVVVMQKLLPLGILRRLPESFGVRFQSLPTREQNVAALLFDAALQLVGDVAGNTADVDRRFGKVALEGSFLAWLHVEDGEFEDHFLANVRRAGNRRAGVEPESTTELGQPAGLPVMACSVWGGRAVPGHVGPSKRWRKEARHSVAAASGPIVVVLMMKS